MLPKVPITTPLPQFQNALNRTKLKPHINSLLPCQLLCGPVTAISCHLKDFLSQLGPGNKHKDTPYSRNAYLPASSLLIQRVPYAPFF